MMPGNPIEDSRVGNVSWKLHDCGKLPRGFSIYHEPDNEWSGPGWWMWMTKEAMEEDTETGTEINEIGETVWENQVEIVFCPFCGERLLEGNPPEGYGRFRHSDHREWKSEFLEGP